MRKIVFSIFLVTVLTLTLQSSASAKKIKHSNSNESTGYELATTIKSTAVDKVNGRNDGMMMNMSAAVGHNKGKEDTLDNMFKIFMMCKTFISTALMFIDPIFKAKNFGLSLISTLITVAKFIMDLKNSKSHEKKEAWGVGNSLISEEDRIGLPYGTAYRPTYLAHYPTYVHKYRMPVTS